MCIDGDLWKIIPVIKPLFLDVDYKFFRNFFTVEESGPRYNTSFVSVIVEIRLFTQSS